MVTLLQFLPLVAVAAFFAGVSGAARRRARRSAAAAGERLFQVRGRAASEPGGLLALAGLGFVLVVGLVLFVPAATSCLANETCSQGPALWVSAAGLSLLGLAAAIVWPALTRNP